jgi:hypothetical protein
MTLQRYFAAAVDQGQRLRCSTYLTRKIEQCKEAGEYADSDGHSLHTP